MGGKDLLDASELRGDEPKDGYPVLLRDWIERDGLTCLKVKLRGNDASWDYDRLVNVGRIAMEKGVLWLTTDFNCTVADPAYVNNEILDRLMKDHPSHLPDDPVRGAAVPVRSGGQPDRRTQRLSPQTAVYGRNMHDWKLVRLGRQLGWTGVALKTCKTQTGALLSLCWAKAHGMTLMVQDLTNPMLAQIPHVLLACTPGRSWESRPTRWLLPRGVAPEAVVHPGPTAGARGGGPVHCPRPGFWLPPQRNRTAIAGQGGQLFPVSELTSATHLGRTRMAKLSAFADEVTESFRGQVEFLAKENVGISNHDSLTARTSWTSASIS